MQRSYQPARLLQTSCIPLLSLPSGFPNDDVLHTSFQTKEQYCTMLPVRMKQMMKGPSKPCVKSACGNLWPCGSATASTGSANHVLGLGIGSEKCFGKHWRVLKMAQGVAAQKEQEWCGNIPWTEDFCSWSLSLARSYTNPFTRLIAPFPFHSILATGTWKKLVLRFFLKQNSQSYWC